MEKPDRVVIQRAIEASWRSRAEAQDLGKPASMEYQRAEVEYFAGATAALQAAFPGPDADKLTPMVPPIWVVNILSGRNVAPLEP